MRRFSMDNRYVTTTILTLLLVIVIGSVVYTAHLAKQLAQEEQKKMQIWSEATRQLIQADENTDINFITSIIEGNTTIPVYMLDSEGQLLLSRNVARPVSDPKRLQGPIEVHISDTNVQYIYYDESNLLYQLRYFPYVQMLLIIAFLLISFMLLINIQRSERKSVWVGLSKETAHQLGTPISSLNAWQQLLQDRYPDDTLIPQMHDDIARLEVIADRFSKIGAAPELTIQPLVPVVEQVLKYMRARVSRHIDLQLTIAEDVHEAQTLLNIPLFTWVIENLIKNAVDAIEREGQIALILAADGDYLVLDISDTGRGIDRSRQRLIFRPGYTTKKRGWGLGLSLAKRIVEEYHRGKLILKFSQVGKGSTFRIRLKKTINR